MFSSKSFIYYKSTLLKNKFEVLCHRNFLKTNSGEECCYDVVVVGGGIVGMASAREVKLRWPHLSVAVLEKEPEVAMHQTGHNSGVIHAGIYYKPGSLRAKLCVEGMKLTYEFCDKYNIPYRKVGKLIVATNKTEVERLMDLFDRGTKNGVPDLRLLDGSQIRDYEPYCKGVKAIHSPHTGIVDWAEVTRFYCKEFKKCGGEVRVNFKVTGFDMAKEGNGVERDISKYPVKISSKDKSVRAAHVLTCGGLYSDHLAQLSGADPEPTIVPFRGEYLLLNPDKQHMVKGNIYPVPDPRFPFLGVHFTPRMDGSVWLGPNAVLAFKREGYRWRDIDYGELKAALKHPGLLRLARKYLYYGSSEVIKSAFISLQVRSLQRFIPDITAADIKRGPSGVRAQAVGVDGSLIEDFVFDKSGRILHCRNAPSPGATSSLAIAKMVADRMDNEFTLSLSQQRHHPRNE